jgi:hypothetical protein
MITDAKLNDQMTVAEKARMRLYVYRWNRMGRKGQHCWVLARGARNSCLVKFVCDGFKMITSRNAIRRSDDD